MKACREIRPLLEWLAANEIADERRQEAEAHLRGCPDCRQELAAWRSLLAAAAAPAAAVRREIAAIDWDAIAEGIMANVKEPPVSRRRPPRFLLPLLAAAAALVVVIGLGAFYWLRSGAVPLPAGEGNRLTKAAAAHLQSGLARAEAVAYLQQSQVMLTGLLQDCANEEMAPWEIRLASRQARELLMKKKYFQPHLSELEWSKVRNVSERIDWLSYEILQLDERQHCTEVARLQRIMERERLLLKIRLVEGEFAWRPYQEA
jgi:anti-sigma factor RsiW